VSTANLVNLVSTSYLTSQLTSTVVGLGTVGYISSASLINLVSTANLLNLVSTTYLTTRLTSTVIGLGTIGYISTLSNVPYMSSLQTVASSFSGNLADTLTCIIFDYP